MNNAVLFLCYNSTPAQLALAKPALDSILAQDIPCDIFVLDNGSAPETQEWLASIAAPAPHTLTVAHYPENQSPVKLVNEWTHELFVKRGYPYILGCPNDILLPANLYSSLLLWPQDMVGAGMHGTNPPALIDNTQTYRIHGDVHMSVVLTRRAGYDKLAAQDGYFLDPNFWLYANDCCLKMRMAQTGVTTAQIENLLCWHYGSASHRLASPFECIAMNQQADRDREYFARKYGFGIGSPEYCAMIAKLG
jgi:glycosyltransferase involved in cell wall biosynthesis